LGQLLETVEKLEQSRRHFGKRDWILRHGEAPETLMLIEEGWAAACLFRGGRRHIIRIYAPGDLCDTAWLVGQPYAAVVALSPVRSILYDAVQARERFKSDPEAAAAIFAEMAERVNAGAEWLLALGQKSALERMALLLYELYGRLEVAGRVAHGQCELPLSLDDLADATGMTSVHASRILTRLRTLGLADLRGRRLRVNDLPVLAQLAGAPPSEGGARTRPGPLRDRYSGISAS
jgi:CRP-like cAMP-binding protein